MEKKTYNGWANYETWATKLWMDNTQGDQEFFFDMAKQVIETSQVRSKYLTKEEYELIDLADTLKDYFEENRPTTNDVYSDLLSAALAEVDWREIAEALLTDVRNEGK